MAITDPNSFDQEVADAQGANPNTTEDQGTDTNGTGDAPNDGDGVDYRVKFSESSKEAQRLFRENQEKDRLIAELQGKNTLIEDTIDSEDVGSLYPGFETLDQEAQENLLLYTKNVTKRAVDQIYRDPAIAFARQTHNTTKWNEAFEATVAKFPELKNSQEEFKSKYFNVNNVPDNIESILGDVAKMHLFDKAKEIGANEERERADRIDLETANGGPKEAPQSRTLEEWTRLAQENPAKFALLSKEFEKDMAGGKLQE